MIRFAPPVPSRTASLPDPGRSFDALRERASQCLREGRARLGFAWADRLCRLDAPPKARDVLLRAAALDGLGDRHAADGDLIRALTLDAADPLVQRAVLTRHSDPQRRREAAEALLALDRASDADLALALNLLHGPGRRTSLKAARDGAAIAGWVAWTGAEVPELVVTSESGAVRHRLDPQAPFGPDSFPGRIAHFRCDHPPAEAVTVRVASGPGTEPQEVRCFPVEAPRRRGFVSPGDAPAPGRLVVIVPIYRDAAVTEACLAALARQRPAWPLHCCVVDDASPDPAVAACGRRFCAEQGASLIVNRVNQGFAASVNAALARCPSGDVLLLNSDVILPEGALDRLIRVAHQAPDIGTVMPFSNDSELTSFPKANLPNPVAPPGLARAIDQAAYAANGEGCVDIVNNIGFCLYIRQACLDAVGPLSLAYGRGYYEDVEFCLKAQQRGWRNVVATGLYVAHASGRSFGAEKRGLVARNIAVLESRFPDFVWRCAMFVKADPLAAARGAIEARLPPQQPCHILAGRAARLGPALEMRAQAIVAAGGHVLLLNWDEAPAPGRVRLRVFSGFGPQSLAFGLDQAGAEQFAAYLAATPIVQIEVAEPQAMPSALLDHLARRGVPQFLFVADAATADYAVRQMAPDTAPRAGKAEASGTPRRPRLDIVAADPMAEAFCAGFGSGLPVPPPTRRIGREPGIKDLPRPALRPKRRIGVLLPLPDLAAERLLLALARRVRPIEDCSLWVIGAMIDDGPAMHVGNCHVSGAASCAEHRSLLTQFDVDALFLPFRTRLFGVLSACMTWTELPRCYFDWSEGRLPGRPDDLVLDHRLAEQSVAAAFARWCEGGTAPSHAAPA